MYKLTVISNNKALTGFSEEHGFSMLIKFDNSKILFDTGNGVAFRNNISTLGIDISTIDSLVLSHGHYDHGGNIDFVYQLSPSIKIFHHPLVIKKRFSIHKDRDPMVRMIGLSPENRAILTNTSTDSVTFAVMEPTQVVDGIFMTGEIPRLSAEDAGGPFFDDGAGNVIDTIPDDQAIWMNGDDGLIIITGCCHSGLINSVEYIRKVSGVQKVKAIIGGLHLAKASESRVRESINYINGLNLKVIYPGHCTGEHIIDRFKCELNCSVKDILAGSSIEI